MTPPNITKGEWTVAAESGQWWVVDQNYIELPETEENARFLSSSKLMAEALDWIVSNPGAHRNSIRNVCKAALLQAGYTE